MSTAAVSRPGRWRRRLLRALRYGAVASAGLFVFVNLIALAEPSTLPAPPRDAAMVLVGVTIVDPDSGGRLTRSQTIEIVEGRISYVGAERHSPAMDHARRIDARGKFAIPGLWDAHVHTLRLAPQLQLPLLIANGVTSVRDMGDTCSWSSDRDCKSPADEWRRGITSGTMVGPRLQQVITFHLEEAPSDTLEFATLLQSLRDRGDPFLKLQLDPQTPAETTAGVIRFAEAHAIRVGGHLPFATDLLTLPRAFVSVEHDWLLLPQCSAARTPFDDRTASKAALLAAWDDARCAAVLAKMRGQGTAYVPTHVASTGQDAAFATGPDASAHTARFVPAPLRLMWSVVRTAGATDAADARVLRDYHAAALQLTKGAHDAGVTVLAGTDALDPEVLHGFGLHDELQYLVRAGLSPAQALAAATTAPARFFGVDSIVGTIAVGQRADILVLDANPLDDIRNTTHFHGVVADGRWYGAGERARLLLFVERQAHRVTIAARLLRGLWYGG